MNTVEGELFGAMVCKYTCRIIPLSNKEDSPKDMQQRREVSTSKAIVRGTSVSRTTSSGYQGENDRDQSAGEHTTTPRIYQQAVRSVEAGGGENRFPMRLTCSTSISYPIWTKWNMIVHESGVRSLMVHGTRRWRRQVR